VRRPKALDGRHRGHSRQGRAGELSFGSLKVSPWLLYLFEYVYGGVFVYLRLPLGLTYGPRQRLQNISTYLYIHISDVRRTQALDGRYRGHFGQGRAGQLSFDSPVVSPWLFVRAAARVWRVENTNSTRVLSE